MEHVQPELPLHVEASPAKIRRRVFRVQKEPASDGTYIFLAHSFTRRDRAYICLVNSRSGHLHCTCPDFGQLAPKPTYLTGQVCKHLARAVRTVQDIEGNR